MVSNPISTDFLSFKLTMISGVKSWMVMELVAPTAFLFSLFRAPLSSPTTPAIQLSLHDPRFILALFYLLHYANRAVISPLRAPGRSKAHISVTLSGIFFNSVNGSLLGTYVSSAACAAYTLNSQTNANVRGIQTLIGIALYTVGLLGNIHHDEILYDLRRDALKKKAQAQARGDEKAGSKPHYGIPYGGLYRFISYPNYFCEWIEWTGYALIGAPFPSLLTGGLDAFTTAAPPWLFVFAEVLLMAPRAIRGHEWYHSKFPDTYPKERRVVIPFIL